MRFYEIHWELEELKKACEQRGYPNDSFVPWRFHVQFQCCQKSQHPKKKSLSSTSRAIPLPLSIGVASGTSTWNSSLGGEGFVWPKFSSFSGTGKDWFWSWEDILRGILETLGSEKVMILLERVSKLTIIQLSSEKTWKSLKVWSFLEEKWRTSSVVNLNKVRVSW